MINFKLALTLTTQAAFGVGDKLSLCKKLLDLMWFDIFNESYVTLIT